MVHKEQVSKSFFQSDEEVDISLYLMEVIAIHQALYGRTTLNMIFSVVWYLMSLWYVFGSHFVLIGLQTLSWMMDRFSTIA